MPDYSLITLANISKKSCLSHLLAILSSCNNRSLLIELSYIGNTLDRSISREEGNSELLEKYISKNIQSTFPKSKVPGEIFLLFNREALRLIDSLLRIKPPVTAVSDLYQDSNKSSYINYKGLFVLKTTLDVITIPILGIFQLANTLITLLEGETPKGLTLYSEKNKIFFSRYRLNPISAIGRTNWYFYEDFPDRIRDELGISIDDYIDAVFDLCCHVANNKYIQLDLIRSFKNFSTQFQEIISKNILLLSNKIYQHIYDLQTIENNLIQIYFNSDLCRQRPLIEFNGLFYCLQPDLLWAVLTELPYYLLLNACNKDTNKVKKLGGLLGNSFENHCRSLGEKVFGSNRCKDYKCTKKYPKENIAKNTRIGDLLVQIDEDTRIIFEFKIKGPDDQIRKGDRIRVRQNFMLEDSSKEGVPQLIRDCSIYRNETSFTEDIYIILVFRGPIPLTSDFDSDTEQYLQQSSKYQNHVSLPGNKPIIWLDILSFELLLSAFEQGIPIKTTLECMAGQTPTQIVKIILDEMKKHNLSSYTISLYKQKISIQKEHFYSVFKKISNL